MDITQWYAVALGCLVALFFFSHCLTTKTRFDIALLFALLAGNIACLIVEEDIPSLVRRLGVMSTINLMPLVLGEHMNFVANRCGVSLRAYAHMHEWLGGVAILEGLVHVVAAVSSQSFNPHTGFGIEALTVSRLCSVKLGKS
jgi:hypothetical protein